MIDIFAVKYCRFDRKKELSESCVEEDSSSFHHNSMTSQFLYCRYLIISSASAMFVATLLPCAPPFL